jgi:glycosyltransferase involved in cell wall biosynthesis
MPEVAGDAALLVNPFSVEEIYVAMKRISSDPDLRTVLIKRGRIRRKLFSWDITAVKLWDCIMIAYKSKNKQTLLKKM